MTERQYWNEDNSLAVVIEGDAIGTLINLDTYLYGTPNPDREVMMERWCLLSQNPSLDLHLRELENIRIEPDGWNQDLKIREQSKKIGEISDLIWPNPWDYD
jgi:hypothetical protein